MKDGVKSEEIKHEWDSLRDSDSCDVYNNSYIKKNLTKEYQKRTSNNNILIVNDYLK